MKQTRILFPDASLAERLADMETLLAVADTLAGQARVRNRRHPGEAHAAMQTVDGVLVDDVREAVAAGLDPLGEAYCALNAPEIRRGSGQTFTPDLVVAGMLAWVLRQGQRITRVVDPGAGSGRYTLAALRALPQARAVAVEMDPIVARLLNANLAAAGLSDRAEVIVGDFRTLDLPRCEGVTLWIGNPPYVRHHDIAADWKEWYSQGLKRVGHEGSQLAGLHLHFFLKTLELAAEGDLGCYVTAAEWMDVKYGQALRQLLTNGLGGQDVFVVDPTVPVFGDALVSAAITCFSPGTERTQLRFAEVASEPELRTLAPGVAVALETARAEPKWSFLVKGARAEKPEGFIELGEMFRVSRGQVTGSNRVWVEGPDTPQLPRRFLLPAVTDASDITRAEHHVISDAESLRRVVCLPRDLRSLDARERVAVNKFLTWAQSLGAHESYVALHRKPWWTVSFREAAPVVMTYMGRRPPVFAINRVGAHIINVAHGLYPRQAFSDLQLSRLVAWLNQNVSVEGGRVYAGGLTKFEPSEAMRILVPADLALQA